VGRVPRLGEQFGLNSGGCESEIKLLLLLETDYFFFIGLAVREEVQKGCLISPNPFLSSPFTNRRADLSSSSSVAGRGGTSEPQDHAEASRGSQITPALAQSRPLSLVNGEASSALGSFRGAAEGEVGVKLGGVIITSVSAGSESHRNSTLSSDPFAAIERARR
jgi:hypothetical protein